MREFMVQFRSARDIQEFVTLASKQTVKLTLGTDRYQVNATSFMALLALNCRKPVRVAANCSEEELAALKTAFGEFLAP